MKRFISLVILSLIFSISYAQESLIAGLQTEMNARLSDPSDDKTVNCGKLFVFKVCGENSKPKGEIEPHFMGKVITEKWAMVNELYLHKTIVKNFSKEVLIVKNGIEAVEVCCDNPNIGSF